MTTEPSHRLAAVWFADIVGYTRLSARDEDAAFQVVRELQALAKEAVATHSGRVVKHLGDAVLAVFDSTNSAVEAALYLQESFRRSDSATAHGVALRIGIHAGEIREDIDGDIYGDGVNMASRVESAAEPWQVVVTDAVYQHIRTRSSYSLISMGERSFKGIEQPLPLHVVSRASALDSSRGGAELQPGALLSGRYLVERLLGMGGMGQVYLAHDQSLGVPVALKVIRDELRHDPTALTNLKREARLCRSLSHRNILRVHDFQEGDGREFLVMEYVEGQTLQERLAKEVTLAEEEVRRIGTEISRALEYAHEEGVIHRDLKPGNILLGADGSVKVADFGLARAARDSMLRLSGVLPSGTLLYMAPEQLDGEPEARSDLYSLGVVLYEMLSGNPPFTTGDVLGQIREKTPKPLERVNEGIGELVFRLLAKNPDDRYQTAAAVRLELIWEGEQRRVAAPRRAVPEAEKVAPSAEAGQAVSRIELVEIPGGRFRMGSPAGGSWHTKDERPEHEVEIGSFALSRYPVTVAEYAEFATATGLDRSSFFGLKRGWSAKSWQTEEHPALYISWEDAKRYLVWLSERRGVEYRLPSEAEWEYAVRAGTRTSWFWGDDASEADRYANVLGDGRFKKTSPVCSYEPNAFGLYDMAGNAWEWTEDCWHDSYDGAPTDGAPWITGGDCSRRVLRGGLWNLEPEYARSAYRVRNITTWRNDNYGFRVARTLGG